MPKFHTAALILAALAALLASPARLPAYEPEIMFGIPGADTPEAKECGAANAYTYDKYIIYTRKSASFSGQDIFVFERGGADGDPCALDPKDAWYAINAGEFGGSNTFLGMRGEYLFIDEWPGRDHKRLLVVDGGNRSLVFFDWYADPLIDDGKLTYNRVLKASKHTKKSVPCPDAAKWESEGLLVVYTEKMSLDLATMKSSHSNEFSCEPAKQPPKAQRYTR